MKINVTTTIDYDKDKLSEDDLDAIYKIFHSIIENSYQSKDLTDFAFSNCDTMMEIEEEVRLEEEK